MAEKTFSEIGKIEAIKLLFKESGFEQKDLCSFLSSQGDIVQSSVLAVEGIDFDLTYFPLKHLGYKEVIRATGEIYASTAHPQALSVRLAVSAKLDFEKIRELWGGITVAAKEHCYKSLSLDILPSPNGLYISIAAVGQKRKPSDSPSTRAESMDLICVSGNLGGAFFGQQILEHAKKEFFKDKSSSHQPELSEYKTFVGEYLKPEINPSLVKLLEEDGFMPSYGYFIDRGLSDSLKRLERDSGLGVKVYVDRMPFMSGIFDLGKTLGIDPISAAFNGGDDYRLLYVIPLKDHDKFRHDFQTFDIIGHLARPEVGAVLVTPEGAELPIRAQGWRK